MRNDPYKHDHNHKHLPIPPKPIRYSNIQKGTSVRIPVAIRTQEGTPVDLTDHQIYFTVKRCPGDVVHDDQSAVVTRDFMAQNPTGGTFYVLLTPRETYLAPGYYYFDFEVAKDGHVSRLGTFQFQLVDGVTNRSVIDSEYAEQEDGEIIPEEELDVILVTEDSKTDTIVVLTNFGQIPIIVNTVESVNGHNGKVTLTAEDVNAYTKEEVDALLEDFVKTVNSKSIDTNRNIDITLQELGGKTEEEIKQIAFDTAMQLIHQFL